MYVLMYIYVYLYNHVYIHLSILQPSIYAFFNDKGQCKFYYLFKQVVYRVCGFLEGSVMQL